MPVETKDPPRPREAAPLAKKASGGPGGAGRPGPGRPTIGKQVNVRLSDDVVSDLEYVAESLHTDISHVVRAILAEHVPEHVQRARLIRERQEAARKAKGGD